MIAASGFACVRGHPNNQLRGPRSRPHPGRSIGIPLPGAASLSTVLGWYLPSPYQKRLDAFFTDVAERLERLEKAGTLDPATLEHNDAFLDAVRAAIDQAARTADEAKREALASAVTNAALNVCPDAARRHLYLRRLDEFGPMHLAVMRFASGPAQAAGDGVSRLAIGASLGQALEMALPVMRGHRELYDQIWQDLHAAGFVNTAGLHGMVSISGLNGSRLTELGAGFLAFVTSHPGATASPSRA